METGHEQQNTKQKQLKDTNNIKYSTVKKDNAFINILLCQRWLRQHAKKKYQLNPNEIEIIFAIKKMSNGGLNYCTIKDISLLVIGVTRYNIRSFTTQMMQKGIIVNRGKGGNRRFYLDLTETGHEMADSLLISLRDRFGYLNDQLELKSLSKKLKRLKL